MMNKKYFIGAFLLFALLFTGCTKEDMDDCRSGLRLDFEFTLHTGVGNLFGEEVKRVRVYLFDENGVLCAHALDNGSTLKYSYLKDGEVKTVSKPNLSGSLSDDYVMNLDEIPAGKYKIMSWAGSGIDDTTTYFHAHMNDAENHNFDSEITLGVTTMDEFRVFVKNKPTTDSPIVDDFDDLWYGAVGTRHAQTDIYTFENVEVKNESVTTRHIELIRNTNILKVTISGIDHLSGYPPSGYLPGTALADTGFKIWVVGANGEYKSDNSIGDNAYSIRYLPFNATVSGNTILADIKILRLDMNRHTADPVLLYIETPDGRMLPAQPLNVVKTLLQARDPETEYNIYSYQSDFDRIYEHPIELRIGTGGVGMDLEIRIFIGEWEIVTVKPC